MLPRYRVGLNLWERPTQSKLSGVEQPYYRRRKSRPPPDRWWEGCVSLGRATSTTMFLPARFRPFNFSAASRAASGLSIVTNPKPRECPVARSVTRWISVTRPHSEKSSRISSSVVLNGRFPTYNLAFMELELSDVDLACPFSAGPGKTTVPPPKDQTKESD